MPIPITIPRLGWDMVEGVFVGWIKADGDAVHAGEALFTLESDKSTEDIECFDNGVLSIAPNGPKKGDKIAVGTVIGHIVQAGEAAPVSSAPAKAAVETTATPSRVETAPAGTNASRPASRRRSPLPRGPGASPPSWASIGRTCKAPAAPAESVNAMSELPRPSRAHHYRRSR